MRFVTYRSGREAARLGLQHDGLVIDVARFGANVGLPLPDTMLGFIDLGPTAIAALKTKLDQAGAGNFVGASYPSGSKQYSSSKPP